MRAALEELFVHGRPKSVELAALIDRGHRELPIEPKYVGKAIATERTDRVVVAVHEIDGIDEVRLEPEQERVAKAYIAQLDAAKVFAAPIATTLEPLHGFYPAEEYHQDFLIHNPTYPYIVRNDLPKIAALKRVYPERYRSTPVMLSQ
mgnify:CR=1 FL=1